MSASAHSSPAHAEGAAIADPGADTRSFITDPATILSPARGIGLAPVIASSFCDGDAETMLSGFYESATLLKLLWRRARRLASPISRS